MTVDKKSREEQKQLDQNEQETISQIPSVTTDETSSTKLQSTQIIPQDTEDITEKQTSDVNFLTDIVDQIHSQTVPSSFEEQQILTDIQKFSQPSRQEDKLSSVDSTVESTQPIIASEEQEQPISRTSTTITKTTERTISADRQPAVELQSTEETDEQVSSDSLFNIIRQTGTIPEITRLPSTESKTETSHIAEQEIEKPSVDTSVEIVQSNESIPHEPVTVKQEPVVQITHTKDVLPESSEISFVTETKQETTSEEATKEDHAEHLSSEALTDAVREILATPLTSQLPSHHVTTETTEFVEQQGEKASTVSIAEIDAKENLRTQQKYVDEDVT